MKDEELTDKNEPKQKKPYSKPTIREVVLRPEEAVLGQCKSSGVSGPAQGRCNTPVSCSTIGS